MPNALYLKEPVPAQSDLLNVRILTDEAFQLSSDQLVEINRRWSTQMIKKNMPSQCSRVLYAIYRHTIEFQKWQDDMSGKRLEQITGIRYDHANETLRILEAGNAIITHTGKYGKWLSINFDFNSWQKTGKSAQSRTNNPHGLLPDYCRDQPIDTPACFILPNENSSASSDFKASESEPLKPEQIETLNGDDNLDHPDSGYTINNNNIKNTTTDAQPQNFAVNQNDVARDENTLLLQQLLQKLSQLEQQFDQKINEQVNTQLNAQLDQYIQQQITVHHSSQNATQPAKVESLHNTANPLQDVEPLETTQLSASVASSNIQLSDLQYLDTQPPSDLQIPKTIPMVQTETAPSVVVDYDKKVNVLPFNYPEGVNQATQMGLSHLLRQAGKHAQTLLDLLGLRLKNTRNPVNNIITYFSSLLRRLQNNKLDLSNLQAHKASQKPVPSRAEQKRLDLQKEYQEANADYVHFERIYTQQANNEQCSLQDYVKKAGVRNLWQPLLERLEQAKSAICLNESL